MGINPNRIQIWNALKRWAAAAAWVYFTLLAGWVLLYLTAADRWGFMGLINAFGVWYFSPLLLLIPLAPFLKRRSVSIGTLSLTAIFFILWGSYLIPKNIRTPQPDSSLVILTFNVLGLNGDIEKSLQVIQGSEADIVLLQELNPILADALDANLLDLYPFQILDPAFGVGGMGVISKIPIHKTGENLPLDWVGVPQVLAASWEGEDIRIINFHMWPTGVGPPAWVADNHRAREAQADAIINYFHQYQGPLIAAGDVNATPLNQSYKIMSGQLKDGWLGAGWGFGHTFPGSDIPGSSRPIVMGFPVPQWLLRLDYVFHSQHWIPTAARLAPFDGTSDHRGVILWLELDQNH